MRAAHLLEDFAANWEISDVKNRTVHLALRCLVAALVGIAVLAGLLNPARDFGPRLLAWFTGWGQVAIPGIHNYLWVPIVGPFVGGVLGAIVYDIFIRDVLRDRGEPEAAGVEAEGRTVKEEPETT